MQRILLIAALGLVQAVISFAVFLMVLAATSTRFDTGRAPAAGERGLELLSAVLQFPIVTIARMLPVGWLPGYWGHLPGVLNGVLWAAAAVFLWSRYRGRRA